jgi:hypothetical protein
MVWPPKWAFVFSKHPPNCGGKNTVGNIPSNHTTKSKQVFAYKVKAQGEGIPKIRSQVQHHTLIMSPTHGIYP